MQTKTDYLNKTVWATLAPSKIHGVGVFAIRDIPQGQPITDYTIHDLYEQKFPFSLSLDEFKGLLPEIQSLILDRTMFGKADEPMRFYSPNIEAVLQSFMNHSDTPNTECGFALREIKRGEELTEDFKVLLNGDQPHPLIKKHHKFMKL